MKKFSKKKKILLSAISVVLAGSMLTTYLTFMASAKDEFSLEYIEKLKAQYASDGSTMRILEIAPSASDGTIGYYVGGSEPTGDWKQTAGMYLDRETRKAYVNTVLTQLKNTGVISDNTNTPLTYSSAAKTYEEAFPWELTDANGNVNVGDYEAQMLRLDAYDKQEDVVGSMTRVEDGYGAYVGTSEYVPAETKFENLFDITSWSLHLGEELRRNFLSEFDIKRYNGSKILSYNANNNTATVFGSTEENWETVGNTGAFYDMSAAYASKDYYTINVTPGNTYNLSFDVSCTNGKARYYVIPLTSNDKNLTYTPNNSKQYWYQSAYIEDGTSCNCQFTVPQNTKATKVQIRFDVSSTKTLATFSNIAVYKYRENLFGISSWQSGNTAIASYNSSTNYQRITATASRGQTQKTGNSYYPVVSGATYTFNYHVERGTGDGSSVVAISAYDNGKNAVNVNGTSNVIHEQQENAAGTYSFSFTAAPGVNYVKAEFGAKGVSTNQQCYFSHISLTRDDDFDATDNANYVQVYDHFATGTPAADYGDNIFNISDWRNSGSNDILEQGKEGTIGGEGGTIEIKAGADPQGTRVNKGTTYDPELKLYYLPVEPGQSYRLKYFVESDAPTTYTVVFSDENRLNIAGTGYDGEIKGNEVEVTQDFVAPNGAHYVQIGFGTTAPDQLAYFSEIEVCENVLAKAYYYNVAFSEVNVTSLVRVEDRGRDIYVRNDDGTYSWVGNVGERLDFDLSKTYYTATVNYTGYSPIESFDALAKNTRIYSSTDGVNFIYEGLKNSSFTPDASKYYYIRTSAVSEAPDANHPYFAVMDKSTYTKVRIVDGTLYQDYKDGEEDTRKEITNGTKLYVTSDMVNYIYSDTVSSDFTPVSGKTYYARTSQTKYVASDEFTTELKEGEHYLFELLDNYYTYVGTGGNYNYKKTGTGSFTILSDCVYYKGGYVNNEWFKKYVMNCFNDEQLEALNVTVDTVTPDWLNSKAQTLRTLEDSDYTYYDLDSALASYELIVISAGGLLGKTYSVDLTDTARAVLLNHVQNSGSTDEQAENLVPVVIDNRLRSSARPNLKRVAEAITENSSTSGVKKFAYIFNKSDIGSDVQTIANKKFDTDIGSGKYSTAVSEDNFSYYAVYDEIDYENGLRIVKKTYEELDTAVTEARCIRYILNHRGHRDKNYKSVIRILDIEPYTNNSSLWAPNPLLKTGSGGIYSGKTVDYMKENVLKNSDLDYICDWGQSYKAKTSTGKDINSYKSAYTYVERIDVRQWFYTGQYDDGQTFSSLPDSEKDVLFVGKDGKNYHMDGGDEVKNIAAFTITTMAPAEFSGKIDDVMEKYDLIYVGCSIDGFDSTKVSPQYFEVKQKNAGTLPGDTRLYIKESGNFVLDKTVDEVISESSISQWFKQNKKYYYLNNNYRDTEPDYKDDQMDGFFYTSTGDTVTTSGNGILARSALGGLLYTDYTTLLDKLWFVDASDCDVRLPGNDINNIKLDELQAFVEQGFPVVIADGLCLNDYLGTLSVSISGKVIYLRKDIDYDAVSDDSPDDETVSAYNAGSYYVDEDVYKKCQNTYNTLTARANTLASEYSAKYGSNITNDITNQTNTINSKQSSVDAAETALLNAQSQLVTIEENIAAKRTNLITATENAGRVGVDGVGYDVYLEQVKIYTDELAVLETQKTEKEAQIVTLQDDYNNKYQDLLSTKGEFLSMTEEYTNCVNGAKSAQEAMGRLKLSGNNKYYMVLKAKLSGNVPAGVYADWTWYNNSNGSDKELFKKIRGLKSIIYSDSGEFFTVDTDGDGVEDFSFFYNVINKSKIGGNYRYPYRCPATYWCTASIKFGASDVKYNGLYNYDGSKVITSNRIELGTERRNYVCQGWGRIDNEIISGSYCYSIYGTNSVGEIGQPNDFGDDLFLELKVRDGIKAWNSWPWHMTYTKPTDMWHKVWPADNLNYAIASILGIPSSNTLTTGMTVRTFLCPSGKWDDYAFRANINGSKCSVGNHNPYTFEGVGDWLTGNGYAPNPDQLHIDGYVLTIYEEYLDEAGVLRRPAAVRGYDLYGTYGNIKGGQDITGIGIWFGEPACVNSTKIDNCSYMSDFLNWSLNTTADYRNVFTQNQVSRATTSNYRKVLNRCVNLSSPSIVIQANRTYNDNLTMDDNKATLASISYPNDIKTGTLQFSFAIKDETELNIANARYRYSFYIDANGDGQFSDRERRTDVSVVGSNGGGLKLYSPKISGANVYTLVVPLTPEDYGILPWKFVVTKIGAEYAHSSVTDYAYVLPGASDPKNINCVQVLQCNWDANYELGNEYWQNALEDPYGYGFVKKKNAVLSSNAKDIIRGRRDMFATDAFIQDPEAAGKKANVFLGSVFLSDVFVSNELLNINNNFKLERTIYYYKTRAAYEAYLEGKNAVSGYGGNNNAAAREALRQNLVGEAAYDDEATSFAPGAVNAKFATDKNGSGHYSAAAYVNYKVRDVHNGNAVVYNVNIFFLNVEDMSGLLSSTMVAAEDTYLLQKQKTSINGICSSITRSRALDGLSDKEKEELDESRENFLLEAFNNYCKNYPVVFEGQESSTPKHYGCNMLVMGFGDMFCKGESLKTLGAVQISEETVGFSQDSAKALQYFIDSGLPVLFCHDSTTFSTNFVNYLLNEGLGFLNNVTNKVANFTNKVKNWWNSFKSDVVEFFTGAGIDYDEIDTDTYDNEVHTSRIKQGYYSNLILRDSLGFDRYGITKVITDRICEYNGDTSAAKTKYSDNALKYGHTMANLYNNFAGQPGRATSNKKNGTASLTVSELQAIVAKFPARVILHNKGEIEAAYRELDEEMRNTFCDRLTNAGIAFTKNNGTITITATADKLEQIRLLFPDQSLIGVLFTNYTYNNVRDAFELLTDDEQDAFFADCDATDGFRSNVAYHCLKMEESGHSVAWVPGSDKWSTDCFAHGFTRYTAKRYRSGDNGSVQTYEVSQVNKGQITSFPYNINIDEVSTNKTYDSSNYVSQCRSGNYSNYVINHSDDDHSKGNYSMLKDTYRVELSHEQYFQVNMNRNYYNEGATVWFCLAGGKGAKKDFGQYSKAGDESGRNYSYIRNDCENAYFVYTKANCTYTGAGHTNRFGAFEAKLFFNTLIASALTNDERKAVTFSNFDGSAEVDYVMVPEDIRTKNIDTDGVDVNFYMYDPQSESERNRYFTATFRVTWEGPLLEENPDYELGTSPYTDRFKKYTEAQANALGDGSYFVRYVSDPDAASPTVYYYKVKLGDNGEPLTGTNSMDILVNQTDKGNGKYTYNDDVPGLQIKPISYAKVGKTKHAVATHIVADENDIGGKLVYKFGLDEQTIQPFKFELYERSSGEDRLCDDDVTTLNLAITCSLKGEAPCSDTIEIRKLGLRTLV